MRKKTEILADGTRKDILTLEVLLDIRDLIDKVLRGGLKTPTK